jgi:hypothetical protein
MCHHYLRGERKAKDAELIRGILLAQNIGLLLMDHTVSYATR